ncbi:MAG: phospholipid carrier-dependent glycosyltransferase [Planctomycetia bacterium]|nr:phospholipid carrier-dependent glycosyltransferase [Planctomycetia bacterium]
MAEESVSVPATSDVAEPAPAAPPPTISQSPARITNQWAEWANYLRGYPLLNPAWWAPRWGLISAFASGCAFAVGVCCRYFYIYHVHPPTSFIYSDMNGYVGTALAWIQPDHQFGPADAFQAPGYHWMLGFLFQRDPTKALAVLVQFLMSIAVPPMLALMTYRLYGRAVAMVSLALSSLYFPFIDYAGYFLSESPFLFSMVLSMLLLVWAIDARWGWLSQACALLSGITLGVSAAIKPAVLLGAVLIFVWLAGAVWRHRWTWKDRAAWAGLVLSCAAFGVTVGFKSPILTLLGSIPVLFFAGLIAWFQWEQREMWQPCWVRLGLVMITSVVGLAMIIVPMSVRATHLNRGKFTLISTNGPMNMQQGHAGENVSGVIFAPPGGGRWQWGSPTVNQKRGRYVEAMTASGRLVDPNRYATTNYFEFAPWDRDRLNEVIWERICEAPEEVLLQSCNNVYETIFTAMPWPSSAIGGTPTERGVAALSILFQLGYTWLILLPAFLHLVIRRHEFSEKAGPGLADGLMVLPFIGLLMTVFLATPEARYRIPFDVFLIVLAARFYTWGVSRQDSLRPPVATLKAESA